MKLLSMVEPLFQYLAFIERAGTNSVDMEYEDVRKNIITIMEKIQRQSGKDRTTAMQYQRMKLPLIFFADSVISESEICFAEKWNLNRIAYNYGELTGDHKFFLLLEETLNRNLFYETECLKIFYICLGFGYTGIYKNDIEKIQKLMWDISDRIPNEAFKREYCKFLTGAQALNLKEIRIPYFIKLWTTRTILFLISAALLIFILFNAAFYCYTVSKSNSSLKKLYSHKIPAASSVDDKYLSKHHNK